MTDSTDLKKCHQISIIVFVAFIGSLLLYLLIFQMLDKQGTGFKKDFWVLLGCSLVLLILFFPSYGKFEDWTRNNAAFLSKGSSHG